MRCLVAVLAVLIVTGSASAVDHAIASGKLTVHGGNRVRFVSAAASMPASLGAAPTVTGAMLTIYGASAGDGDTGIVPLEAIDWRATGNPATNPGYRYRHHGVNGLKVVFGNGRLVIAGKGSGLPYTLQQVQGGPIHLLFTIGADVVCARLDQFDHNDAVLLQANATTAPSTCAPSCGNGMAERAEACDDGNTTSGDGCSAKCALENVAALCAGVPNVSGTNIASELIADGLDRPLHVTAPPLDPSRVFIVEQGGRIRVVKYGHLLVQPFLDLSVLAPSPCFTERGVLSLAFDPQYASNGRFFVFYTAANGDAVVARYQVSQNPDVADPMSAQIVLSKSIVAEPFGNHYGGQVAFGPDGYLYVGFGDGSGGGDPSNAAQDGGTWFGKLLRIDVSGATYTIPASNPFVGPSNPLDEIWATGFRQPYRFSFDRGTGNLYVADVGQEQWEEIDVQPAASAGGENYGWSVLEGNGHCFDGDPGCASPGLFVPPVFEYDHAQGCAVIGGFVYRGCGLPDVRGTYVYGDYCAAFIRTFDLVGGVAQHHQDRTADLAPGAGRSIAGINSFGEDARGELYVVDPGDCQSTGEVYRIVPHP